MGILPTTLTQAERRQFETDGFVAVRGAFARDDAEAMEARWWAELAEVHGVRRDDPATWRQPMGDLKRPKTDTIQARILTSRMRGAIDDLLGAGEWEPPRDWGRALVTFPTPGAWDVPTGLWHWDSPLGLHRSGPAALFVVSFIGEVGPRGGGTLILAGSPRLLLRQEAALSGAERAADAATRRTLFQRSHPWLRALTGLAASPADRVAAFMGEGAEVEGVALRVVELTGAPGDVVLCHPAMVHCIAPNRGERPRFMRIRQQLLTREGRRQLRAL